MKLSQWILITLTAILAAHGAAAEPMTCLLLKSVPRASAFPNADTYWQRFEETATVQPDGTVREAFHATARILTSRGMDNADVTIPYNLLSQKVGAIKARTIRPDGAVLQLRPADVHETSPNSEFTLYDDARNVAFSLPGVEEGAIIDYRYTIRTFAPLQKGQFSDAWWFAGGDPCRLDRYTLIAPANMPIRYQAHNASGIRFSQRLSADGKRRVYSWETRDNPDVTTEPSMPPQESYAPWLEVSTWPSWQAVAQWYHGLAAPRMTATPEITALVRRLTAGKTTERERAQAIFYWVERRTRYVALEQGISAYQPHAAATVFRNRYGDCKDMATLMVTMLHEAGIDSAWPALLDTDSKLPLHTHLAVPDTFDHVIVRAQLDGAPYWFDATAELCTFGDIPGDDRGVEAFVVRRGVGAFETIPWGGPEANRTVYWKNVTLHPDGSAECRTIVRGDGDAALEARAQFRALKPDELPNQFQSMVDDQTDARLLQFHLSACGDPGTPMTYGVDYTTPAWAIRTGKLIVVSDGFAFSAPTEQRTRHWPLYVDTGQQLVYNVTVTLPPGYTVDSLPDPISEKTPLGTMTATYKVTGGTLIIQKVVTLIPATIAPALYSQTKADTAQATQRLTQPIVLCPIKG